MFNKKLYSDHIGFSYNLVKDREKDDIIDLGRRFSNVKIRFLEIDALNLLPKKEEFMLVHDLTVRSFCLMFMKDGQKYSVYIDESDLNPKEGPHYLPPFDSFMRNGDSFIKLNERSKILEGYEFIQEFAKEFRKQILYYPKYRLLFLFKEEARS